MSHLHPPMTPPHPLPKTHHPLHPVLCTMFAPLFPYQPVLPPSHPPCFLHPPPALPFHYSKSIAAILNDICQWCKEREARERREFRGSFCLPALFPSLLLSNFEKCVNLFFFFLPIFFISSEWLAGTYFDSWTKTKDFSSPSVPFTRVLGVNGCHRGGCHLSSSFWVSNALHPMRFLTQYIRKAIQTNNIQVNM